MKFDSDRLFVKFIVESIPNKAILRIHYDHGVPYIFAITQVGQSAVLLTCNGKSDNQLEYRMFTVDPGNPELSIWESITKRESGFHFHWRTHKQSMATGSMKSGAAVKSHKPSLRHLLDYATLLGRMESQPVTEGVGEEQRHALIGRIRGYLQETATISEQAYEKMTSLFS